MHDATALFPCCKHWIIAIIPCEVRSDIYVVHVSTINVDELLKGNRSSTSSPLAWCRLKFLKSISVSYVFTRKCHLLYHIYT